MVMRICEHEDEQNEYLKLGKKSEYLIILLGELGRKQYCDEQRLLLLKMEHQH